MTSQGVNIYMIIGHCKNVLRAKEFVQGSCNLVLGVVNWQTLDYDRSRESYRSIGVGCRLWERDSNEMAIN
jgi:hypothetical protein